MSLVSSLICQWYFLVEFIVQVMLSLEKDSLMELSGLKVTTTLLLFLNPWCVCYWGHYNTPPPPFPSSRTLGSFFKVEGGGLSRERKSLHHNTVTWLRLLHKCLNSKLSTQTARPMSLPNPRISVYFKSKLCYCKLNWIR